MSMSIDNYASQYSNLYNDTSLTSTSLDSSLENNYSNSSDEELLDVCKQFESYFTEQIFSALQKMVPENEEESSSTSSTKSYFEDMLTQQYAENATDGEGLGIAQMLYEQMKRNYSL